MAKYLKKFYTYSDYDLYIRKNPPLPNLSCCTENNEVYFNPLVHDYTKDYLTFVALEDGAFSATADIDYSLDGVTWTKLASIDGSYVWTDNFRAGQKIMWTRNGNFNTPIHFKSTGKFDVQGNIMSIFSNNHATALTMNYSAANLFEACKIVNAKNLVLPATTLSEGCYEQMFDSCENLITAPQILPATDLTNNCYADMFSRCTSLVTTPKLPATRLAESCYNEMFEACTNLVIAPELPAERLAEYCYNEMFEACTNLVIAPELPATTLASNCYAGMFNGCTSLINAPELPATTLADSCYRYMFNGCSTLENITCLATDISANNSTYQWVQGVASNGTFYKASEMNWPISESGTPNGWAIKDYNG